MDEQVGVNAPGRQKMTARFPLNKSLVLTSFHVNGLLPPIDSSLTRALNVTEGIASPSVATIDNDLTDAILLTDEARNAFDERTNPCTMVDDNRVMIVTALNIFTVSYVYIVDNIC